MFELRFIEDKGKHFYRYARADDIESGQALFTPLKLRPEGLETELQYYSLQKSALNLVYIVNLFIFAPWLRQTAQLTVTSLII